MTTPGTNPPERTASLPNANFFGALFDFSFTSFITTKLIPVLYGIWLVLIVLSAVIFLTRGGAGIIFAVITLVLGVIWARVVMETIIVFFRIAEHTRDTAYALRSFAPTVTTGPPSPPEPGGRFDPQTGQPLT